ncbi:hypothetical protein AMECASPLE_037919 [Ameca splendens]|uniref:Pyrin domain-containing protein n=1 Tax=Ameca splendens TaxID=208324 RepID=A0ABV1A3F8_9TELE
MTPEDLLNTLDNLGNEEFIRFKWFLQNIDCLQDFPTIKKGQLQMANREDTVDLMVQTYRLPGALKVTGKILEKINRNDLLQSLSVSNSKPEVCVGDVEDSSVNIGHASSQTQALLPQREGKHLSFFGTYGCLVVKMSVFDITQNLG